MYKKIEEWYRSEDKWWDKLGESLGGTKKSPKSLVRKEERSLIHLVRKCVMEVSNRRAFGRRRFIVVSPTSDVDLDTKVKIVELKDFYGYLRGNPRYEVAFYYGLNIVSTESRFESEITLFVPENLTPQSIDNSIMDSVKVSLSKLGYKGQRPVYIKPPTSELL